MCIRDSAERFYELLKGLSGETVHIDGSYPIDQQDSLEGLLRAAEHNEHEEYADVYQAFGDTAKEEGFHEAASAFYQIAEIEHIHEKRFGELAEMLETNTYYNSDNVSKWLSLIHISSTLTNSVFTRLGNLS